MHRRGRHEPEPEWLAAARAEAGNWPHLTLDERERLVDQALELDRTRAWEGLGGLDITASMRAAVAARACLLTVDVGLEVLADVSAILVAPTSQNRRTVHAEGSVVTESDACVLGASLLHGPVRLAWDQVAREMRGGPATSLVLHEFAHKVDMADGHAGGTPPITDREALLDFERTSQAAIESLWAGEPSPLRPYAASNRVELFAVATEAFFLRPGGLRDGHPDLYRVLAGFYRQDPAAGTPAAPTPLA
jgi:Mlc titration factor MtfA (ptsG expression regulator)